VKSSVLIATPTRDGTVDADYTISLIASIAALEQRGIAARFQFLKFESLIPRGRNRLVDIFRRGGASVLVFVDADHAWDANDLCALVAPLVAGVLDIAGVACSQRSIDWEHVRRLAIAGASAEQLAEDCSGSTVIEELAERQTTDFEGRRFRRVRAIGTGCLAVSSRAIEVLVAATPHLAYVADHASATLRPAHALFHSTIDDRRYLRPEDFSFCDLAWAANIPVWCLEGTVLPHFGAMQFRSRGAT
jgi:hypothetical protein